MQDGVLIGHAGTIRRRVQVGSQSLIAGQSIDAMTHPDHQKKGINQALNQALGELHKEKAVALVYGFSNQYSTPSVIHHQNRIPLSPFPVMVRPLRWLRLPLRLLLRKERGPVSQPLQFPTELDALWDSNRDKHPINMVRDDAYFRWRYARPNGSYQLVEIRSGGTLKGVGVLGFRTQMGLLTAFITDVVVGENDPQIWDQLVAALTEKARNNRCDMISALAFPETNAQAAFHRAGLWSIPEKLNPEDIVFSVRDNRLQPLEPTLSQQSAWHLCWAEHDLL